MRVKLPADLHLPRYTKFFSLSGLPTFCSYSDYPSHVKEASDLSLHHELPLHKGYRAAAIAETVRCSPNGRQGTMARREDTREWLTRKVNLAWQKRADIMRGPSSRPSSMRSRALRPPHMSKPPIVSDN